jgi:3-deoxy-D-arabino-heptulosonate 7-phosphate (DAHP) synthase class II
LSVIQSFPEIWHDIYEEIVYTRAQRVEAFEKVRELMNIEWMDATALEKKFVNICDQIVKRIRAMKTCGVEGIDERLHQTYFFDADYLVEYYQRKKNKNNVSFFDS